MLNERTVFVNKEFVPWDKATVHMMSHSFARGSAIFEVLSLHATAAGPAVFRLQDHIDRLFKSAEQLNMQLPLTAEEFSEAVVETVRRNALQQGYIKIMCYYPQIALEVSPPNNPLDVAIFALDPFKDFEGLDVLVEAVEKGIAACVSTWRKLDPQTVPIEAKAAANYLNGMVAKIEAQRRGFHEALMLDTQGFIAEGGSESFFFVKDGRLMTSVLGTILQSITRRSILEVARAEGIETIEARLHPRLLSEIDEMFTACTPIKVFPIIRIDERILGQGPGPVTRRLSEVMQAIAEGRDERFSHWLYPV